MWQALLLYCERCGTKICAAHPASMEYLQCEICGFNNPTDFYKESMNDDNTTLTGPGYTPNSKLPPIGGGPRRKMLVEIEVCADFGTRLDNQWMVEREIHADRWKWRWANEYEALVQAALAIDAACKSRDEQINSLRNALLELAPWFEGEHHPDHPSVKILRVALDGAQQQPPTVRVNNPTAVVFREFQCSKCGWMFGFALPAPAPLPTMCSACDGRLAEPKTTV